MKKTLTLMTYVKVEAQTRLVHEQSRTFDKWKAEFSGGRVISDRQRILAPDEIISTVIWG